MTQTFSRDMKDELVQKIKGYFQKELDQDLGSFEAEFLLDFFSEHMGPHYYNQAVRDVQKHLAGYLENLNDKIDELEQAIPE